jgi:hypothetical protein
MMRSDADKTEVFNHAVMQNEHNIPRVLEQHYTIDELSERWHISPKFLRRIFVDEPGVVKFGRSANRLKREKIFLRVPASVAERVHTRLSNQ